MTAAATNNTDGHGFRPVALVVAWLLPGMGHVVAGHRTRGLRILAGMSLLMLTGLFVGGIDAVDRREERLWFLAQAGCGPIVFAVDYANQSLLKTGRVGPLLDRPLPAAAPPSMAATVSGRRGLAHAKEFGTLFIALAGMMNVVVILDAGFRRPAGAAP